MVNNKQFFYAIGMLLIGGVLMYFGEGTPPVDRTYTLGLMFIAIGVFYMLVLGTIKFIHYMLVTLGHIKGEKKG